ncbi:MAG: molybdopterin-dependent oxidoreductase, partial [Hyphomicrobiales bacterium]|nr:molybdopterin-dependent oxidoreductase [Hyphomicrobiales bacterium]
GETEALRGGPPVMALLVQNTNPACVAPDQEKVKRGLARDDLFTVVHEHFLTDTAAYADVVLPATMFHEHDDLYQGGGHQHVMPGAKACEAPGECRSNHDFLSALARRVGARHPGFDMSPRELADWTLRKSGHGTLDELEAKRWLDVQPDFRAAHFLDGFGHADGKFHFLADWASTPFSHEGPLGPFGGLPTLPDHWPVTEETDAERPYKLATSPARSFLNSSFNQTPGSAAREGGGPSVLIHADDAAGIGVEDGGRIALSNRRGAVTLRAKVSERVPRGTLVSEGLWPNSAFEDGRGINTLTGDDAPAPFGGDPVHDIAVAARPA